MPTKTAELLICKESFVGTFADNSIYVGIQGKSIVDPSSAEGKRILKDWAKFFRPITVTDEYGRARIEQATAAPGELRGA
jgi:hypothetical protein